MEFLRFEVSEIDDAALEPGEDETLKARINLITNAETIFETAQRAYTLLYEEDETAVVDRLATASRDLDELAAIDERFVPLATQLAEAQAAIDSISAELRVYTSQIEFDPQELNELNRRSTLIGALRRKYGATVADVLAYREKAWAELSGYENRDEQLATLKREASSLLEKITEAGTRLSAARQKAGRKLEKEVTTSLQELGMKGARFEARIETVALSLAGFDRAVFQLAANQGEAMKPLKQVASGGEMSRIMLAIKTVLAGADTIPTLIFDEVDAGVGGDVARKVAQKLQSIATSHQVLCVTHLAQIAAVGDVHFTVAKASGNGRTRTDVTAIGAESREKEIARLLDGSVSGVSLEHARALLSGKC
jgi:DNA repair protein RecN (Recombination protein N)